MLEQLNSLPMFLIAGGAVAFVIFLCVVFIVRSWRAGVAMGIDKAKLRRAVTSSATFTVLPAVSILLGVIALSGSLGIPLPWLRLSVVGAFALRGQRRRHRRTRGGHGGRPWQRGPYGADVCHHRLCDDSGHPFRGVSCACSA